LQRGAAAVRGNAAKSEKTLEGNVGRETGTRRKEKWKGGSFTNLGGKTLLSSDSGERIGTGGSPNCRGGESRAGFA